MEPQRCGRSLIEKNSHVRSRSGQTEFRMLQDCFDLLSCYAGKPFKEFIDRSTGFHVFKKRLHRNARAFENPGAADFVGHTLNRGTLAPIKHLHDDKSCKSRQQAGAYAACRGTSLISAIRLFSQSRKSASHKS